MRTSTLRRRVARAVGLARSPEGLPDPPLRADGGERDDRAERHVDSDALDDREERDAVRDALDDRDEGLEAPDALDDRDEGLEAPDALDDRDEGLEAPDERRERCDRGDVDGRGDIVRFGDAASEPGRIDVAVSRRDDGTVFEGGQSNWVQVSVSANEPVLVRDRVPANWTVTAVDDASVVEVDGERFVEFAVVDGGEFAYVAQASTDPAHTGRCEFGPIAYSVDGESWTPVGETSTAIVVDVRRPNHGG